MLSPESVLFAIELDCEVEEDGDNGNKDTKEEDGNNGNKDAEEEDTLSNVELDVDLEVAVEAKSTKSSGAGA